MLQSLLLRYIFTDELPNPRHLGHTGFTARVEGAPADTASIEDDVLCKVSRDERLGNGHGDCGV